MQMLRKKKATIFQFDFSFFGSNYSHFPFITNFTRILYPYLQRDGEIKEMLFISELFNLVNIFGFCTFIDELYLSFIYIQSPFQGQKSQQKSNEATVIRTHWSDFKWYQHFKDVMVFGDVLLRKGRIYNPVFLSIISGSEQRQKEILTDYM